MNSVLTDVPAADHSAPHEAVPATDAEQLHEQRLGRKLVSNLFVLLKTAYVHQQNNTALHRPLANIQETVNALFRLTRNSVITLRLAANAFFLNDTLVRLDRASYQNAEFLRIICGELRIETFEFYEGCQEQAFRALMVAIVDAVRSDSPTAGPMVRDLETIYLKPPPNLLTHKIQDRRQFALQSYALALTFASQLLARWPQAKRAPLSGVKRTVQSLLDVLTDDSITLLGLTQLQASRQHLAYHLVHVSIVSLIIGRHAGLAWPELVQLGMTALLHELGARELPPSLLECTTPLSTTAQEELGHLPLLSIRHLLALPGLGAEGVGRIVSIFENRAHVPHAYPYHTQYTADMWAQIVAVADAYDHLTTSRMGHTALPPDQALSVLLHSQEGRFAPWAIRLLIMAVGRYPIGTMVELDTGELGIVCDRPEEGTPGNRPKLRLITAPDGSLLPTRVVVRLDDTDATGRPLRSIRRTLHSELVPVNVPHYFLD
jgi:HD-GYP domain-containing protein (c-di-GMP phosphodiesterase class II)